MKHSLKKTSKLFIIIPTVVSLCIAAYLIINIVFSPYWDSVYAPSGYLSFNSFSSAESDGVEYTKEQASEDIDYILKCLERVHPLYKDGLSQKIIEQANNEKSSFNNKVDTYQLWRSVARILSAVGDSHTMSSPSFPRNYLCDYIEKSDSGFKVLSINGISVDDLFSKNSSLFSYELEKWGKNRLADCFETLEGLRFIGIDTSSVIEYTYVDSTGKEQIKCYTYDDFLSYNECKAVLGYKASNVEDYSYSIDLENDVGLFTLNSCVYDNEYKEAVYNFFTEVIDKKVNNVVVDLRDNMGGNSLSGEEFTLYLNYDRIITPGGSWRLGPYTMEWSRSENNIKHYDDMLFNGSFYVLTSSDTFSSATSFASTLSDKGFGKIVGESCGNKPDSFGEVVVFQTPNSAISFQISSKHFCRIDESKADLPLIPDYEVDSADALQSVYEVIAEGK